MDKYGMMVEWVESTTDAINALSEWKDQLTVWWQHGGELQPGDFDAALRRLCDAMGDGWADGNPAGGGLDALAAAVQGEERAEQPATALEAIFGREV